MKIINFLKISLTILLLSFNMSFADKVIYELSSGNIIKYDSNYAYVDTNDIEEVLGNDTYIYDWNLYGFGFITSKYSDYPTNSIIITNINDTTGFFKIFKLTEDEIQKNKSYYLKSKENEFIIFCDYIAGTTNKTKLGTSNIYYILSLMTNSVEEKINAITLGIQFFSLDLELKRENGILWWDTCIWHDDI